MIIYQNKALDNQSLNKMDVIKPAPFILHSIYGVIRSDLVYCRWKHVIRTLDSSFIELTNYQFIRLFFFSVIFFFFVSGNVSLSDKCV